jgi:hypothetical protein
MKLRRVYEKIAKDRSGNEMHGGSAIHYVDTKGQRQGVRKIYNTYTKKLVLMFHYKNNIMDGVITNKEIYGNIVSVLVCS